MDFLSDELVSSDYRNRLQNDLRQASLCRFLVAYISIEGIDSIGRSELLRVLRHKDSLGIGSLTCCCGFEPLVRLQRQLGEAEIRLKYFMDPKIPRTDEPDDLVLLHSKLVYLHLPEQELSVVYIGSHNWTSRAVGPGTPRNAEASLRFELPYSHEHLVGTGPSIASHVNRHLLTAYRTPVCLAATSSNRDVFEQWYRCSCRRAPRSPLEQITIILAVRKSEEPLPASAWTGLVGSSIYMPVFAEGEGQRIRRDSQRILVMVWESTAALAAGDQPVLLRCHLSTQDPSPTSVVRGTNRAMAPIAGFRAVAFDARQLLALQSGKRLPPSAVTIWSKREVEFFDFEFPTGRADSSCVDGEIRPDYRFLLEIDDVVLPADRQFADDPALLWTRESFAVAQNKHDARLERIPGYQVPANLQHQILECLTREFQIDPKQAKALPVSDYDLTKEGRQLSQHPLHDTFIGPKAKQRRSEFYEETKRGALVADLDEPEVHATRQPSLIAEPIRRVERLYTMKMEQLRATWSAIADKHKAGREAGRE